MKETIKVVLTNHRQSSLEGLHMLTGGTIEDLNAAISELLEEGWLKEGKVTVGYDTVIVYKRKQSAQAELWKS